MPRKNLRVLGNWATPDKAKLSCACNWECTSQHAEVVTPSPFQDLSCPDNLEERGVPSDQGIVILDQVHICTVIVYGSGLILQGTGVSLKEHEGATTPTFAVSRVATQALATPDVRSGVGGDVHSVDKALTSPVLRAVQWEQ